MKKIIILAIAVLFFCVSLAGCGSKIDVEIIIVEATPTKLSFFIENRTDTEFVYGDNFIIFIYNEYNSWERFIGPFIVHLIGYPLAPHSKTDLLVINFPFRAGEGEGEFYDVLKSGRYKIQKEIFSPDETYVTSFGSGKVHSYYIHGEFIIP